MGQVKRTDRSVNEEKHIMQNRKAGGRNDPLVWNSFYFDWIWFEGKWGRKCADEWNFVREWETVIKNVWWEASGILLDSWRLAWNSRTLEEHRSYLVCVSRWTELARVHKVFLFLIILYCLSSYTDNILISRGWYFSQRKISVNNPCSLFCSFKIPKCMNVPFKCSSGQNQFSRIPGNREGDLICNPCLVK